jgi:hypothetical protein
MDGCGKADECVRAAELSSGRATVLDIDEGGVQELKALWGC